MGIIEAEGGGHHPSEVIDRAEPGAAVFHSCGCVALAKRAFDSVTATQHAGESSRQARSRTPVVRLYCDPDAAVRRPGHPRDLSAHRV